MGLTMATLTKKDLLEAIKDMPMDATFNFVTKDYQAIPIVKIQTWPKWNSIDLKGEGYI